MADLVRDSRVTVEGADLDVRIELAPRGAVPDKHGVILLAKATVMAIAESVVTVQVRGVDDHHYAVIVVRESSRSLLRLPLVAHDEYATRIFLTAGEQLHLFVVASDLESGLARLRDIVAHGGIGLDDEAAAAAGDDAVADEARDEAVMVDIEDLMVVEEVQAYVPQPGRRNRSVAAHARTVRPETTNAYVDATMPRRLRRDIEFVLLVRLSREELAAIPGLAQGEAEVMVDAARKIRIAVALRGMDFAPGQASDVDVDLPELGAPRMEIPFRVTPTECGRGYASVAVRQLPTPTPLATIKLSAMIVDGDDQDDEEPQVVEATLFPPPPELADLPTISIDETFSRGTSHLRITATVHGQTETNEVGFEKAAFIDGVYEEVRAIRRELGKSRDVEAVAAAQRSLRATGSKLAAKLFSGEIGAFLWRRRNHLAHLVVQSSGEVDIPWEIVHLVPPKGRPDDVHSNFLGDKGLTRWVYDTARPTELPVRADHVIGIAPDYRDPELKLARNQEELRALRENLDGDTQTAATPRELREAIAGGFDLVHFAGHGRWREDDPRGQEIAFAEFVEANDDGSSSYRDAEAREDLPELDDPSQAASHPVVFLSACDVGRLRAGATGLGGFAEVFLRGGVGVFVGCSWAVQDDAASAFVKAFYRRALAEGSTIGEATLAARRAAHRAGDLNALAFAVFADPRARLVKP